MLLADNSSLPRMSLLNFPILKRGVRQKFMAKSLCNDACAPHISTLQTTLSELKLKVLPFNDIISIYGFRICTLSLSLFANRMIFCHSQLFLENSHAAENIEWMRIKSEKVEFMQ
jgi:hypothetical protein